VRGLYRADGLARRVEARLAGEKGVRAVKAAELTGSVLILFDAGTVSARAMGRALRSALREERHARSLRAATGRRLARPESEPIDFWRQLKTQDVAKRLRTSLAQGLSNPEAKARLTRHGPNELEPPPARSHASILASQFDSLPIALLGGSALLSVFLGAYADAAVILAVMILNGGIGYATESSAEKTISRLTKVPPARVPVLREGRRVSIAAAELVPGDLIPLSPGLAIPADARVTVARELTVDESALTGESLPVTKFPRVLPARQLSTADHKNMIFRGTVVTGGSGEALLVSTGPDTAIGRVQRLMGESAQPDTPLQQELEHLGNRLALLAAGMAGVVIAVGWLRGLRFSRLLKTSVSLAVAAIPESLPTIATTTLATAVRKLHARGVFVRRLDALETLGGADVICLDKTGTITQNKMLVTDLVAPSRRRLAELAALCTESSTSGPSSTEEALLSFAEQNGVDRRRLLHHHPLLTTRYRSAARSYMTTIHRMRARTRLEATKGRPDQVLASCTHILSGKGHRPLSPRARREIARANERMAGRGLRVLGFARKEASGPRAWAGLVGLADPLRPGVDAWIERIHAAGIGTTLITGDQPGTAAAIGHEVGIEPRRVFARVAPAEKLEIVRAFQESGRVVAMVGDGVNDGPALKVADVGIAVGGPAPEITSKVADIFLLKSNFPGLLATLREGRRIQEDIKKAVDYIVTQNLAEMLVTLLSIALGLGDPMTPLQYLWMNLVTDIFPELALAQEPPEADLLRQRPSHARERLLSGADAGRIGFDAASLTAGTIAAYALARRRHGENARARSVAFLTLVTASLLYSFSARSHRVSWLSRTRLPSNKYLPLALGLGFGAEAAAAGIPSLRKLLGAAPIDIADLSLVCTASIAPLLAIEAAKLRRAAR
jgi:Ca2+-transporting ATPase